MDVSQFLKSFKKNVAAKAKASASVASPDGATAAEEAEELRDVIRSDSEDDVDDSAQTSDYVAGSRADKFSGKRYAAHAKSNQDFAVLRVFDTNATRSHDAGRMRRQRAALLQHHPGETRKGPREEMVAAVRADLLRQREQLQQSRTAPTVTDTLAAPLESVSATMVQVEDLLQSSEPTAASSSISDQLSFLPPVSVAPSTEVASSHPDETSPTATVEKPVDTASKDHTTPASSPAPPSNASAEAEKEKTAQPAKKRSKFELAMAMAKADEEE